MQPPRPHIPPPTTKNRSARASSRAFPTILVVAVIVLPALCPTPALSIVTTTPAPTASATPFLLPPNAAVLPLQSSLFFVLDEPINSRTSASGSYVRAHLRDALVVHGVTVAPKGAPVEIEVVRAERAQMGNVNGSVHIYFQSFTLADGKKLALSTPTALIDPHMSTGQYNTRALGDTVGDIFIPYHVMYHYLRKGQEVDLRPGTVIRARTAETVAVAHGAVVLQAPAPFTYTLDAPHSAFDPVPLATPRENPIPPPKASPSPSPVPSPSP